MPDIQSLGPWLRRFFEEYLVTERNLARNTQISYRDTSSCCSPSRPTACASPSSDWTCETWAPS